MAFCVSYHEDGLLLLQINEVASRRVHQGPAREKSR